MDLFEMVNGHAFPSVHALMIEPFKTIWENDTSDAREESIKKFTYIELVCSPKRSNPYFGYGPDQRPAKVKHEVWKDENYELDTLTMLAVSRYMELLKVAAPGYELLEEGLEAAKNLRAHLKEIDYKERTNSGAAVYKPKEVVASLEQIPALIQNITIARDKVHSELLKDAKTRNQRQIGQYER